MYLHQYYNFNCIKFFLHICYCPRFKYVDLHKWRTYRRKFLRYFYFYYAIIRAHVTTPVRVFPSQDGLYSLYTRSLQGLLDFWIISTMLPSDPAMLMRQTVSGKFNWNPTIIKRLHTVAMELLKWSIISLRRRNRPTSSSKSDNPLSKELAATC